MWETVDGGHRSWTGKPCTSDRAAINTVWGGGGWGGVSEVAISGGGTGKDFFQGFAARRPLCGRVMYSAVGSGAQLAINCAALHNTPLEPGGPGFRRARSCDSFQVMQRRRWARVHPPRSGRLFVTERVSSGMLLSVDLLSASSAPQKSLQDPSKRPVVSFDHEILRCTSDTSVGGGACILVLNSNNLFSDASMFSMMVTLFESKWDRALVKKASHSSTCASTGTP